MHDLIIFAAIVSLVLADQITTLLWTRKIKLLLKKSEAERAEAMLQADAARDKLKAEREHSEKLFRETLMLSSKLTASEQKQQSDLTLINTLRRQLKDANEHISCLRADLGRLLNTQQERKNG